LSHFSVGVFSDGTKSVYDLLRPYGCELKVEPWIKLTRELLEEEFQSIKIELSESNKRTPRCSNLNGKSKKATDILLMNQNEFSRWYHIGEDNYFDEFGNLLSKNNPNRKWDWYKVGGQWDKLLVDKSGLRGNAFAIKNIDWDETNKSPEFGLYGFNTFAVITPDGTWYSNGSIGSFCIVTEEDLEWEKNYSKRFIRSSDSNFILTIVDCHV